MLPSTRLKKGRPLKEFCKRLALPSLGDFIFVIIFLFLIRLLPSFLFGDGGTGWHLATGKYILETGRIPYAEFISYTFAGKPWITQYWFSDLIMYLVQLSAGYNAQAVFFAALYGAIFLWLYHQCRREGASVLFTFALVMVAALASSVQFLARPLIVSWFMIFLFALLLENFQQGKLSAKKAWLWFFLSSIFWTNCHSGYIIGVAQVIIYLGCNLLFALLHSEPSERTASKNRAGQLAVVLLCVFVGVSLNPYGLALHSNIMETLANKSIIDSVTEFKSPSFHGGVQTGCLELLFAAVAAGLYVTSTRVSLPRLVMVIAFGHLALYSVRNAPVFALIAAPFIAQLFSRTRLPVIFGAETSVAVETNGSAAPPFRRFLDAIINFDKRLSAQEVLNGLHVLPVSMVLFFYIVAVTGGGIGANQLVQGGFSPGEFPSTTLQAVKNMQLNPKEGFNDANWGGYIFYEAGIPVYIDDRGTFFGDYYVRYGRIISLYPEWKDLLKEDGINWVIYRKHTDFANALASDPDWTLLAEDQAAVLFGRKNKVPATH